MSWFHHSDRLRHLVHRIEDLETRVTALEKGGDFTREDQQVTDLTQQVSDAQHNLPPPEQQPKQQKD